MFAMAVANVYSPVLKGATGSDLDTPDPPKTFYLRSSSMALKGATGSDRLPEG